MSNCCDDKIKILKIDVPAGDGFGTNPRVTDNGDGTFSFANDEGQVLTVDLCAAAAACGLGNDGFGTNPLITDNGDGTITLSNDEGDLLNLNICAAVSSCDLVTNNGDGTVDINGETLDICAILSDCDVADVSSIICQAVDAGNCGGDGFGTNPTATDNGDGTITLSNDEGDSLNLNICQAISSCDLVNDNGDGTVDINGETLNLCDILTNCSPADAGALSAIVCSAVAAGECAGEGVSGVDTAALSYFSWGITWHHDATTPFGSPFDDNLAALRLGSSDFGDEFFHPYFGPPGPVCLKVLYSNDSNDPQTLNIQEIVESDFNTNFSVTPLAGIIGSATLLPNTNGAATFQIDPVAGNGIEESSILYYYVPDDAGSVRIMAITVTECP